MSPDDTQRTSPTTPAAIPSAAPAAPPAGAALEISAEMLDPLAPPVRDPRRDFEKDLSYVPLVSLLLIGACAGIFVWMVGADRLGSAAALVSSGALHRESVLGGQVWRILSYMFLHGGFEHIIGNVMMLYVLGMGCEHAFGRTKMALMYVAAGVGGGVLSLIFQAVPTVGASGAIFGLAGMLIAFLYRHQSRFYVRDKRIGFVILAWAAYTVVIGFLSPEIDNWCHIGGFVTGVGLGATVPPREFPDPVEVDRGFAVQPRRTC